MRLRNIFASKVWGAGVDDELGDGALVVFLESEGDVAGEDEELGGRFGEEFLGLWAEGLGFDVEAGGLHRYG